MDFLKLNYILILKYQIRSIHEIQLFLSVKTENYKLTIQLIISKNISFRSEIIEEL